MVFSRCSRRTAVVADLEGRSPCGNFNSPFQRQLVQHYWCCVAIFPATYSALKSSYTPNNGWDHGTGTCGRFTDSWYLSPGDSVGRHPLKNQHLRELRHPLEPPASPFPIFDQNRKIHIISVDKELVAALRLPSVPPDSRTNLQCLQHIFWQQQRGRVYYRDWLDYDKRAKSIEFHPIDILHLAFGSLTLWRKLIQMRYAGSAAYGPSLYQNLCNRCRINSDVLTLFMGYDNMRTIIETVINRGRNHTHCLSAEFDGQDMQVPAIVDHMPC
ncbi:hypothetical protein EV127DRAFT_414640 [Xylaria flabelliformis]|nr:hypothetical protein EV127DRAFT_414640 [Xylaria flabelliformis]